MALTETAAQENSTFGDGEPVFETIDPEESQAAQVIETSPLPFNFYSSLDFSMGLLIGFYSPVQKRWRNWDCRSQFFSLALNLVGYAKRFDKPFEFTPNTLIGLMIQASFTGFGALGTMRVCTAQWDAIQTSNSPWPDNFKPAEASYAEYLGQPRVSAEPTGTVSDVLSVVSIVTSLLRIRSNLDSHYYYFFAGAAIGSAFGSTLTFADKKLDLGIITPEDPWDRYN